MKILLGGAFGHLGQDILKDLLRDGYEVVALGRKAKYEKENRKITIKKCDVTNKAEIQGICKDINIVISTIGLTSASKEFTHYDVDLQGNINLLNEAIDAGVKKFIYVSVLNSDQEPKIPMLDAKYKFEQMLQASNIDYTIYRPTGYFYDISYVFKTMVEKGTVRLLKGDKKYCNVIHTKDFAQYIVKNIYSDSKKIIDIGGNEIYSYDEIANIFFDAAGKTPNIKYISPKIFNLLAFISKIKKDGNEANIKFSKWTLSNNMVACVKYGNSSFIEYIYKQYR